VIGLKALLWYQAWSEDINMPYGQKALDMYSVVEGAIVNGEMPARYALDLLSKA